MPKIATYPSGLRLAGLGSVLEAGLGSVLEAGLGIGVSAPYKNNNNIHL
jgi:hypothetical protein